MKKNDFLRELEMLLSDISEKERKEIIYDYQEHFQVAHEKGKTEEAVVESLGSPQVIARELRVEFHISRAKKEATLGNIIRASIATIGLNFLNLAFIVIPFLILIGVLLVLYCIAMACIVFPFRVAFDNGMPTNITELLMVIFTVMTTVGVGGLLGVGLFYFGKWLNKGFVKLVFEYLNFNLRIIKGR